MKKNSFTKTSTVLLIALLFHSCQSIEGSVKAVEFEYDNKSILLKAPKDYCFYDEKFPIEKEMINIVREINDSNSDPNITKYVLQKCDEKKRFLNGTKPLFRNTAMITFYSSDYLKELRKCW